MKKIVTSFILLSTCISLVGCSDMSNQSMGTLGGAAIGGLVGSRFGGGGGQVLATGLGAVAGAVIGNAVGKSMDNADKARMNQTLESNPAGQPAYWTNSNTGTTYTVTPTQNITVDGNPYCREYRSKAVIAGKTQQMYGTACRQPDGTWKMVSSN